MGNIVDSEKLTDNREWKEYNLENISIITDCVNKTAPSVDYETPFKMLRTPNIRNGRVSTKVTKYVVEETFKKWSRRGELKIGDIILTREAPMGEVGMLNSEGKFFLGQRTVQIRAIDKIILPEFLYYSLLSSHVQNQIKMNEGAGSVVSNIRIPLIKVLKVKVPNLKIQNKIVAIMNPIDKKIELNNQINQTLEEMAQCIFKEWFVEFNFPNEDGVPYKDNGGEMVESELGEIPEGWRVRGLGSMCDIEKGLSYKGKHLVDEGVPMVNLGSVMPGGGYREDKIKFYDGDFKERHQVSPGDIIIANTDMTQDRVILGSVHL